MNAQEYIASGLLEAYVLGALPLADVTEISQAVLQYPDVAAEVLAIEEAFLDLGKAGAVTPPPELQDETWNKIQNNKTTVSSTEAFPKVIEFNPQRAEAKPFSFAKAAVWAALIASGFLNIYLWNGRQSATQTNIALQQQLDTVKEGQRALAIALSKYENEVTMMANPNMNPVVMKTTNKDQPMVAVIYYNKEGNDAYVSLQRLPEAPQGMQYQLWSIADGKPVDLGVIRNDMVHQKGIEKVNKNVPSGQAFAISLEKEGGSPVPTMDKIFVMGKVAS